MRATAQLVTFTAKTTLTRHLSGMILTVMPQPFHHLSWSFAPRRLSSWLAAGSVAGLTAIDIALCGLPIGASLGTLIWLWIS
ncbi:MAG: hypothetical protein DWH79_01815 [Planctomycetota bacterium]|nr:MAG: hypothetical protein DWH79_01815 [Planctomycetota bacterium]